MGMNGAVARADGSEVFDGRLLRVHALGNEQMGIYLVQSQRRTVGCRVIKAWSRNLKALDAIDLAGASTGKRSFLLNSKRMVASACWVPYCHVQPHDLFLHPLSKAVKL